MKEVTCLYCGEKFDIDSEEWAQVGKRYVHKECLKKRQQQTKEIAKLAEQEKEERKKSYITKKKDIRKCLYCGGIIDIAHEEWAMVRTRYVHKSCYEKNYSQDEEFVPEIYRYLKEEIGISYDYVQCENQRQRFIQKMGYTNEGILNALKYFYGVKKESPQKSGNRIGIVPYVYDEAKIYYEELSKRQKKIKEDIQKQIKEEKVIIHIRAPEKETNKGLIDLDSIGGD